MASVTLDRVWLLDPTETGTELPLLFLGSRAFDYGRVGEVRRYAGGRRRLTTVAGQDQSVEVTVWTDAAGLLRLQGWAGRVLLYRDGLGTRMWCTYLRTPYEPTIDGQHRQVTLLLTEVTYSEAV